MERHQSYQGWYPTDVSSSCMKDSSMTDVTAGGVREHGRVRKRPPSVRSSHVQPLVRVFLPHTARPLQS